MRNALIALAFAAATLPGAAHAWWSEDWSQRTRVTLDTTAKGQETQQAAAAVSVALRLHSGNFDFVAAKEDGSDLRVLAADDKTPLKFSVERFDSVNELALLWVQLPSVLPGSDKNVFHVYAGNAKATVEASRAAGFDAATLAALHFDNAEGTDHLGRIKAEAPLALEPNGLLGASLRLDGRPQRWALDDGLVKSVAGSALTLSLWVKLDAVASARLLQWGGLSLAVQDGKLQARLGTAELGGGAVAAGRWTHLALRLDQGQAALFVGGAEVAKAPAALPTLGGALQLGEGARGLADELQIATVARSDVWLALAAAIQGGEGKLLSSLRESAGEAAAEGEDHGYIGVLVKNLTIDAWVVIIILGVMFVVAAWVMVDKSLLVGRADKDNRQFLQRFRAANEDLLKLDTGAVHPNSPLYRLYQAGVRELAKRRVGQADAPPLSGASLDAVKAAVDADFVRENHKLNAKMVLLTIAISGGPFLGLLGTVVGVMITFAAIAAAGDVNVNAIAPGIAAALLATVAGLGVAIPALFGYNYLAARIKNLSSDMQIFVDEFITRVAELYGAR